MTRAPVGLGDVLLAIAAIAPDEPARWPAIAAALGFEAPPTHPPTATTQRDRASASETRPREIVLDRAGAQREASLPVLAPLAPTSTGSEPTPFLLGVEDLPEEQSPISGPPLQPLLPPATTASILRATALVPDARGPLDIPATVDLVARRCALERLPRRRAFGLSHDVLVLQDLGEGMDGFLEDVDQLVDMLQGVIGRAAVRIGGFLGRPVEALAELGVHRGTAVVVLTDLGLSRLASPEERGSQRWTELADTVARSGARMTVLVPWPADRWPRELAGRLALVTWDRTTTVAQVLGAVRDRG